jgi:hypothetical protein
MSLSLLALYCALAVVLMRPVLEKTRPYRIASCEHCGLPRERRELGERICGCSA